MNSRIDKNVGCFCLGYLILYLYYIFVGNQIIEEGKNINMNETKLKSTRNLLDFCKNLNKSNTVISWDKTVEHYAQKAATFKEIFNQPEFNKSPNSKEIVKRLDSLVDRCVNSEFQIAFVGTIKAGKSTLINAILGQNIASTRVTPETAVLTKFRSSEKNYVKVKFYSKNEWDELWKTISTRADVFLEEYKTLNGESNKNKWIGHSEYRKEILISNLKEELERWSSSKHVEHYFVKEIEVSLENLNLPENVVFVDTPGLNDPVKYRSDVTRNYIDRANAVFICVTVHAMTGEETKIIYSVFANSSSKDKIFVIGTQIDNLNVPEQDWQEQHNEWCKYLSEKSAFGDTRLADSHIIPTAAYMENLCREYLKDKYIIKEEEKKVLFAFAVKYGIITTDDMMGGFDINNADDYIEKLKDHSHIDKLLGSIRTGILSKYRQFLIDDIIKIYNDLKKDISNYFNEVIDNNKKMLAVSNGDINEIRKNYTIARENSEIQKKTREALMILLNDLKENNKKRLEDLEDKLTGVVE